MTRRVTGLTDGTKYTFTVAARYGTVWSNESALSAAVAPAAALSGQRRTGPDGPARSHVRRSTVGVAQGDDLPWTQIRPTAANNGGLPQDPQLDLNPNQAGVQSTTGASTTPALALTAPLLSTPTSDHNLQFRLSTAHSDGVNRIDLVDVKLTPDTVTADEVRWRAGDEIGGTGSQENAQLTLLNGAPTGQFISTVLITNGEWTFAGGAPALTGGNLYVWSNYGFTGTIRTTD